jgi:hypothetical protein
MAHVCIVNDLNMHKVNSKLLLYFMNLADESDSVNHVLVGGFGQHLNDA